MTEAGDDSSNDLAIAVLADQNMRPCPAIPRRNHELLSMPEGEDNVAPRSDIDRRPLRGRARQLSMGVSFWAVSFLLIICKVVKPALPVIPLFYRRTGLATKLVH
jgi:hypothetical protein